MQSRGLFICTTCFSLTSLGEGMQVCRCEEYKAYPGVDCPSGYHLCYLCAATVVGGTGRYSWTACESCLKFNRKIGSQYGIALPLGRHSIMNGIAVPMSATGEEKEQSIDALLQFIKTAGNLSDWGTLQARQLFESVPSWRRESKISRSTWEEKFHLSKVKATSRSVQAIKDYLGIDDFPIK